MTSEGISVNHYLGSNLAFIVGSPRSGTTWIQKLIASHPRVRTGPESHVFGYYIGPELRAWNEQLERVKQGKSRSGLPSYFSEQEFIVAMRQHMMNLLAPMLSPLRNDQIFLEKSPDHALFLPEIAQMLPEAKIIHILRDGRDVVASILGASQSWGIGWAPNDPRTASRIWVRHVKAVRRDSKELRQDHFLEIRYEDLISSTNQVLKRTTDFLNLEWAEEDMTIAIEKNRAEVAKQTGGTEIKVSGETAMVPDTLRSKPPKIRKGRTGSWKEDLSIGDKFRVWRIARRTMGEMGYHWPYPWSD